MLHSKKCIIYSINISGGGNYNLKGNKVGKWLDLYYSKNI